MDLESMTYEDHTKKARKKLVILLVSLILVVAILGSVFLYVSCTYNATDFSLIRLEEDAFYVTGGFLYPRDEGFMPKNDYVASYNLNTGKLHKYALESFDLSSVGLDGEFSYFRYQPDTSETAPKGPIYAADQTLLPLCYANTDTKFVYVNEEGQKFLVDTARGTSAPLFANSTAEGVDPYGKCITQFSRNGLCAIGMDKNTLTVYIRANVTDHTIGTVHKIDLSEYGKSFDLFFVSENYIGIFAYEGGDEFTTYICNAQTAELAKVEYNDALNCKPEALSSSPYGQIYCPLDTKKEDMPSDTYLCRYVNVFTAAVTEHKLSPAVTWAAPIATSPSGQYALINAPKAVPDLFFSKAGSRQFGCKALEDELLGEGAVLEPERVYFLADNIVLANYTQGGETKSVIFKICF
ncbi:MAG: hypothetical protein IKT43_05495 [Clostridia bacterium]|nr:hypothetical protein [Clostridia bacterium]